MSIKKYKQIFSNLNISSISDALDSLGIKNRMARLKCRSSNSTLIGFAYTVKYDILEESSNYKNAGNYIDNVSEDEIVLIDNGGRSWCTTWGGILTKFSILRKIGGAVVYGAIRDLDEIKKSDLPIYSSHVFMASGKNRVKKVSEKCLLKIDGVEVNHGDLIVGDINGVLFIPNNVIEEVFCRAQNIEKNEKNIVRAIESGMKLSEARKKFNYSQPWDA